MLHQKPPHAAILAAFFAVFILGDYLHAIQLCKKAARFCGHVLVEVAK